MTNDIQHKKESRGQVATYENLAYNNLMGANQDKSLKVMNYALQLAA